MSSFRPISATPIRHDKLHSPNLAPAHRLAAAAPEGATTSWEPPSLGSRSSDMRPRAVVATAEQQSRDLAAEQVAARRRSFWMAEHPEASEQSYFGDPEEYTALGRELVEAGLGTGLTSQWLAMCCSHYRAALDGGAFRFLDTHQTVMQSASPGLDPRLVCVRCGATFPRLNRETCRGNEIYRERVRDDKARLGSVLELYSLFGGG